MSYIGNEGIAPTIQLDSVGIGLELDANGNAINVENLDLNGDEYLVVGEKTYYSDEDSQVNTKWSLIVNREGVSVNTSRSVASNYLNADTSFFVDKNINCSGIIKAVGLELNNIVLDGDPLTSSLIRDFIINANNISANQPFQAGIDTSTEDIYNYNTEIKNVYTTSFVTLGGVVDTYDNTHPLNIVSTANNKFDSMHIAIRNDTTNAEEPSKLSIGIIGGSNLSPSIISTTAGMPLEFHVGKSSQEIDGLYGVHTLPQYSAKEDYPSLAIDADKNVGIGTNKTSKLIFDRKYLFNGIVSSEEVNNENTKFQVKGISCFDDVVMYDYYTKSYKNLDDIYIRSSGISTLNATQIQEGDFLGTSYNFNKDLNVKNNLNANTLSVDTNANINNLLETKSLIVNDAANFTGHVRFDDDVDFTNVNNVNINKLKINNDIYIGDKRVIPIDIDDPSTGYGTYSRSDDGSNFFFVYVHSNIATLDANCNISFPKKLAIGLKESDGFDGVLNIIKDDETTSNNFDITLKNTIEEKEYYANIGRLSRLDYGDNSLILNTNKVEGKNNNIYFYPSTNMSELTSNYFLPNIKNTPPTLSLNKERVSINKLAAKTGYALDVNGNVAADDYYVTYNNEMQRTKGFIYQQKNFFNIYDSQTNKFCVNYNNLTSYASSMKGFNVKNGINADLYYQNDKIIETLQIANNTQSFFSNKKLAFGWSGEEVKTPLQIRNLTTENNNYSVIRIYRGVRGGGALNNADYSGIDICEYDRNLNSDRNLERWFIYKNHKFNDIDARNVPRIGPLQIGYTSGHYAPKNYGMSFYYNSESSNYHIDVNKPSVSYHNNNSAMSIYGDLDVHGNINIIDDFGSNYNFRLSNLSAMTQITQYITTIQASPGDEGVPPDDDSELPPINNDIRYTGYNILYTPNKSVIVDPIEKTAIPIIVKQDNSNLSVAKFITYSDNNLKCSSALELGIYNTNLMIADDDFEKTDNIKNMVKFNVSSEDDKHTNFDMSFYHDGYYKKFYNFKNNIDDSGNFLASSTHIGVGNNIDNNSNVTLHIDDINKYGVQITNNHTSPAINLLYTGGTSNIYHTITGASFENNYRFSIDIANQSTFNEPESSNIFVIDAFENNNIRKGARFGFNDTELKESFAIKTDYDTPAMGITSRYSSVYVYDSVVDIQPENLVLTTLGKEWDNLNKLYKTTYFYNVTNIPDIDNNLNPISDNDKYNPNFLFKSDIILSSNFLYTTHHSNLSINYNVSNINFTFDDYSVSFDQTNYVEYETICTMNLTSDNTNIVSMIPELSYGDNTIMSDDLIEFEISFSDSFTSNLTLINNISSNYTFNYSYNNTISLPSDITCNISYYSYFSSNHIDDTNLINVNNIIYTDILPFDNTEYFEQIIHKHDVTRTLIDNGIYSNIFLNTSTSNIIRYNSNINFDGKFIADRINTIFIESSNILPDSLLYQDVNNNLLDFSYNIVLDGDNSNVYIKTSNYVVNNNVNSIQRDQEFILVNNNYLITDDIDIYGNVFTNKIYITEYYNKLAEVQNEDYIIRIKNYNYKNFKPHITLNNDIESVNKIAGHEIYSYDGVLEIKYIDSSTNNNWVPMKIDAQGNVFFHGGLDMRGDLRFDGKIFDANGNDLIQILNKNYYKEYEINSSNIHFNSLGSNGVEIRSYSSSNYDSFKFFYVQDYMENEVIHDVLSLHKNNDEQTKYKIDLYGDIDTSNGILRVEGRDVIEDSCNFVRLTCNLITDRITNLETDFILEKPHSINRFIINHEYDFDLLVNGSLTINSNLNVLGETTTLNTDVYTTEQLDIENTGTGVAFKVKQDNNYDIVNILNNVEEVFTILHSGNVGIRNDNPEVALDINTTDSIKIPRGNNDQRPTKDIPEAELHNHIGYIRYNTELEQFEGFGQSNYWNVLGGVRDVDRDTYITAENEAGADNNELKFYTLGHERTIIKSDGKVGIGISDPLYMMDIVGDLRLSDNLYIGDKIGINNESPYVGIDINTTDSIKIPRGNNDQRPTKDIPEAELHNHIGYIRYNTELEQFEGFGQSNYWNVLGGVRDVDRDTYITAENEAGADNNELKFYTLGHERTIIKSDGKVGIGISDPLYMMDIVGDLRLSDNLYIGDKIGINNESPYVGIDINTTDSIKIPRGNNDQRPTKDIPEAELHNHIGYIRYNTELEQFEGFGQSNYWNVLGGVRDVDRDTYITAENEAGADNNELKFYTLGHERTIIKSDGKVGVGISDPAYVMDIVGDERVSQNLYIGDKIGINNESPYVGIDINTTDSIKIPRGNNDQRPTKDIPEAELHNHIGYIRYNTELEQFEGFGQSNYWNVLGGVRDVDRDTYITAENEAGADNNELKFYTLGQERTIIKPDGKVGVGISDPAYVMDIVGDERVSQNLYIGDKIGINNESPYVGIDINTTDSIKIPRGNNDQRPTKDILEAELHNHIGYIRYNTELEQFEGFGQSNYWNVLGGVRDVDRDTYITAENEAGADNNELKFYTLGQERTIIKSDGKVGVGISDPAYVMDIVGDERVSQNLYIGNRIGIKNETPYVGLDINTTDSIKIPRGDINQRPTKDIPEEELESHIGYIRYNTELEQFEGFGAGKKWGSLGGVKDVDGDTYISAENIAGEDNDELKFFTSNIPRMVITSNGLIGIDTLQPEYKLDVVGGINIKTNGGDFIYTIDDRDIIRETSNYVLETCNIIFNKITYLETDFIAEKSYSSNKFIVNNAYDNDLYVYGNLTASNLTIHGITTTLNTDIYATEQLDVQNSGEGVALNIKQSHETSDIINISNDTAEVFTILNSGKVGINNPKPIIALDIMTSDGLKIPSGNVADRPSNLHTSNFGIIRYNTELKQFEGYGEGEAWGSLGGVKDVNGNTYISAENEPGEDNNELKFYTSNLERMIITSNGLVGIGNTQPEYTIDITGEIRASSDLYIGNRIGIKNETPYVGLDINTTDSIKIPRGDINQRPTKDIPEEELESHIGYIRYNTELEQFEGFGAGKKWGSLGGVKDVDGDTYISAENIAGEDNDELKFFTSNIPRMVITSNGLVGIGTETPNKNLTIYDDNAILSIRDPRDTTLSEPSIEFVNGANDNYDNNVSSYGWKMSSSNNQYIISSGSNYVTNDRFIIDAQTGNIGIGKQPHVYEPQLDEDEFKVTILGSINIEGDIYRDGTLFYGGGSSGGSGGGSMGVVSQNMTVQTFTETYTKTCVMSENDLQNTTADYGWRFIDNDLSDGFVIRIKPSHRKSKILLNLTCHIGFDSTLDSRWWGLKLYRKRYGEDWTEVKAANGNYNSDTGDNGDPSSVEGSTGCWISHNLGTSLSSYENFVANVTGTFSDSPDTRKEVYYTVKWKSRLGNDHNPLSGEGDLYLNRPAKFNNGNTPVLSSTWVAQELWQLGTPYIPANGSNVITLYNQDYVGIGNTEPVYELDVVGKFRSTDDIYVDTKIGINTYNPAVSLVVNATDSIQLPSGNNAQRPTNGVEEDLLENYLGNIRYNSELKQFEGFGAGNAWGSLGGVKDVNGDTYISAENAAGEDNNELSFYTCNIPRMTITSNGLIGIGNSMPKYSIDIDSYDGIKIPVGTTEQRPTELTKGIIRYNTSTKQFEGFGAGDAWGSLGGVKDVDGDTYISAETEAGEDNDELTFYTCNIPRMIITSNGLVGVGNTSPNYKIDVNGEINASAFNINGSPFRLEFPAGMALQTKHLTYTETQTKSNAETDWVAIDSNLTSGFVIRIKPTHTTSKILLNLICHIGMDYLEDSRWWGLKLFRKIGAGNWSEVTGANGTGLDSGSACWISHNLGAESSVYSHSITNVTGSYEDSPQTTEDVYYTVYWKSRLDGTSGRLYLNKSATSSDENYPKPSSSWSASEILNNGVPYVPPVGSSIITLSGNNVGIGTIPTSDSQYKLNVDGNIKCTSLFQTSDQRFKNNIEPITDIIDSINKLVPVSYTTIENNKNKYGFIAQDLQKILPNVVNVPQDTNDMYSIDYISLIPLLTKSIQELSSIVNIQQNEINNLKTKL